MRFVRASRLFDSLNLNFIVQSGHYYHHAHARRVQSKSSPEAKNGAFLFHRTFFYLFWSGRAVVSVRARTVQKWLFANRIPKDGAFATFVSHSGFISKCDALCGLQTTRPFFGKLSTDTSYSCFLGTLRCLILRVLISKMMLWRHWYKNDTDKNCRETDYFAAFLISYTMSVSVSVTAKKKDVIN